MTILAVILCLLLFGPRPRPSSIRYRRPRRRQPDKGNTPEQTEPRRFRARKPEWVRRTVLVMYERTGLSHRKLAGAFNRAYTALTGESVGRTWVRELLLEHAYRELHQQQQGKHRLPTAVQNNAVWGLDTTTLRDSHANAHTILGLIDHGSRLNLALRALPRFNTWTLLGAILIAIGYYGKPAAIRLDNHPVHHARRFRTAMRWLGIRLRFTQPASPWQNGRIERFFGCLKAQLGGITFSDPASLAIGLVEYRAYYNHVRPHQHLDGRTPADAWRGIDPYRQAPRRLLWFEGWGGRLRGEWLQH